MGALRPHHAAEDRDDDESPEALLISAFLEVGEFDLPHHHISSDDIEAWRKLWDFCVDYQEKSGQAPPLSLVTKRYPDFNITKDVSVSWAADQVRKAAAARRLRHAGATMAAALREDDLAGAFEAIEHVERPRGFTREPADIFDHALLEDRFNQGHIEVPFPTLQRLTNGGVGNGELWYMAARFAQGKTHTLTGMAARAAEVGCHVGIASLEMPAGEIANRVLRRLAGRDTMLLNALDSEDILERKAAQDQLLEKTAGTIRVFDPSYGTINTVAHITSMCQDYDIVFLDHVGLMRNHEGKRAVDDWRILAQISNMLRETTLASNTPVVGAAQINREGENPGSARAPKANHLAGSDSLGQDADVVVTQKKLSKRVAVMSAEKVRNGPIGSWYTRFDPAKGRFEEIDYDTALEIMAVDGDL